MYPTHSTHNPLTKRAFDTQILPLKQRQRELINSMEMLQEKLTPLFQEAQELLKGESDNASLKTEKMDEVSQAFNEHLQQKQSVEELTQKIKELGDQAAATAHQYSSLDHASRSELCLLSEVVTTHQLSNGLTKTNQNTTRKMVRLSAQLPRVMAEMHRLQKLQQAEEVGTTEPGLSPKEEITSEEGWMAYLGTWIPSI